MRLVSKQSTKVQIRTLLGVVAQYFLFNECPVCRSSRWNCAGLYLMM